MSCFYTRVSAFMWYGLILTLLAPGCSDTDAPSARSPQSSSSGNRSGASAPSTSARQPELTNDLVRQTRETSEVKPEKVSQLRELMVDSDIRVRLAAAEAMVEAGEDLEAAQEILLEGLGRERNGSAQALNKIGEPAIPAVLMALKSEDVLTRKNAAFSLGLTWSLAKLEDRISALSQVAREDPEAEVRGQAAVAISILAGKDAMGTDLKSESFSVLNEALADSSQIVRKRMSFSVGLLGNKAHSLIPAMIPLLQDQDSKIRGNAANSLGMLASPYPVKRARIIVDDGISSEKASPEEATRAIDALIAALSDQDAEVRSKAARGIWHIGGQADAAVPALTKQLTDSEEEPRLWAATAIVRVAPGSTAPVSVLEQAIANDSRAWKAKASRLLQEISSRSSVGAPDSAGDSSEAAAGK